MNSNSDHNSNEINIFDLFRIVFKRKWFILSFVAIFTTIFIVRSKMKVDMYTSQAVMQSGVVGNHAIDTDLSLASYLFLQCRDKKISSLKVSDYNMNAYSFTNFKILHVVSTTNEFNNNFRLFRFFYTSPDPEKSYRSLKEILFSLKEYHFKKYNIIKKNYDENRNLVKSNQYIDTTFYHNSAPVIMAEPTMPEVPDKKNTLKMAVIFILVLGFIGVFIAFLVECFQLKYFEWKSSK